MEQAKHLHQVDLFRILTFACVIGVHVLGGTTGETDVPSNAAQMLLHFTREAFFALTGFVLVYSATRTDAEATRQRALIEPGRRVRREHSYSRRPLRPVAFWRRRFPLIGVPYLVWTLVYWALPLVVQGHFGWTDLEQLGLDTVEGTACYHLYFLLVTMQVYLLLPPLMWLLRATAGRHRWVLAISAVGQLGADWLLTNPPATAGTLGDVLGHGYATIFAYQFYTVLGAVAALHFTAVHGWVRRHGRLVASVVLAAGAAVLSIYAHSVATGAPPAFASGVFQPYAAVWFVAFIIGLYALASEWGARRRPGDTLARLVSYGSDRSFGIFLAHPLVLAFLLAGPTDQLRASIGQPWTSLVAYLTTAVGAVVLTELLRRSPLSLATTGRRRTRRRRADRPVTPRPPATSTALAARGGSRSGSWGEDVAWSRASSSQ